MASDPPLSYEDYKGMLSVFRVPELQSLLSSCGRCRSGRKGDLLTRALNLIRPSNEGSLSKKARSRILELYRFRFPESNLNYTMSTRSHAAPYSKDDKLFSQGADDYSKMSHVGSPRSTLSKSTSAVPVHPDVQFRRLPFNDLIDVLVKPTSLVQKSMTGYQQMQINFHLTPHQVQRISHARSYSIQGKVEYSVQAVLRFSLAETSCVQDDLYPPRCSVVVNGRTCPLPGQVPSSTQHMEPRKPHRPINLTHFCRLSPLAAEQIRINWLPSDIGQRFTASVELIKVISAGALVQKLKSKAERNADHSRALIKEKLMHDPDSEIATTSLKVSLCCPIGRMKMSVPCRASTCSHVQCFDAALYIQMNERKPSWICPVCDQKAYFEQLVVDGLFCEIIRESPGAEEIVFFQNGSWKPLSDVNDVDCKPIKPSTDTINLLPGTPDTGAQKDGQTEKRNEVEVIDLLSDSDDDDTHDTTHLESPSMNQPPLPHPNYPAARHLLDPTTTLPMPPPLVCGSPCAFEEANAEQQQHMHQKGKGPRFRHVPHVNEDMAIREPHYYNQSLLDLYSILPPADRIAAALYLDQAGLLANPGGSSSDIISLD